MRILLYLATVIATHYVGSFLQASLHAVLGHRTVGGRLYWNHTLHHHANYSRRMVSERYLDEDASNTPFYVLPSLATVAFAFVLLPPDLAVVLTVSLAAHFAAQVYLHTHYHLKGTWLGRFAWFRRRQVLHFEHHRHVSANFSIVEPLWDRLFGTFREPRSPLPGGEA
jgi:sterol desaturase/sphingolipid hydroxylase (fatty acid hydroxylase superfamily)